MAALGGPVSSLDLGQAVDAGFNRPPSGWGNAGAIGGDVYVWYDPDEVDVLLSLLFWHWCPPMNRWRAAGVAKHTLVSTDPLHLEPSLLWPCCGKHGFVRAGHWVDA